MRPTAPQVSFPPSSARVGRDALSDAHVARIGRVSHLQVGRVADPEHDRPDHVMENPPVLRRVRPKKFPPLSDPVFERGAQVLGVLLLSGFETCS